MEHGQAGGVRSDGDAGERVALVLEGERRA